MCCRRGASRVALFLSLLTAILLALLIGCDSSSMNTMGGNSPAPPTPTSTGGMGGGSSASTVAYVYVASPKINAPGQLSAFFLTSDAVLHSITGSPYTGPSASPVVTSAYLFVTDGTNIQTYERNSDGSLALGPSINGVAHNDSPSGSGVGSLSLDRSGQSLYASEVNFQGADNDAYAAFNIATGGALNFLANTSITVNASPLQFSQDDRFAYRDGCYFIDFELAGYARSSNGLLTEISTNAAIPPAPTPDAFLCPGALAVSALNYLAAEINTAGQGGNDMLASYRINSDGSLSLVPTAGPNTTALSSIVAMSFDPSGTFLAIAGQGGLQLYQLAPDGSLAALGTPQLTATAFNDVRWDHANHLLALSGSMLYVFNVAGGAATQATGSPYNVIVNGTKLAVLPTT